LPELEPFGELILGKASQNTLKRILKVINLQHLLYTFSS
jgi:hypothetical protein